MKKGLLFLAFVTLSATAFAEQITTITAVQVEDRFDVTITWRPADEWFEVELRGNYEENRWDKGLPMTRQADGSWTITLKGLAAGTYEYKFFADDTWMDEAYNYPVTVGNPFGGVNGALVVNEALVAGIVTEVWSPTVFLNLNAPLSFRYRDAFRYQAQTFLRFQGFFKLHGEILPGLFTFTETNLHGPGNGQITLYGEHNTATANRALKLRATEFFTRGISVFANHFTELQKFFIEYRTPFVDISYSDGFHKWIPEAFAGPFIFTMYGVDATRDNNAMMGTWRLMKRGLDIAEGISLDYMVSWGMNARRLWGGGAIWDEHAGAPIAGGGTSWYDNRFAFYGSANYVQVDGPFGAVGLNIDLVAEAPNRATGNTIEDFFTVANRQFSLGYKGDFAFGSLAFQWATQMANTNTNRAFEYNFGRHSVIGAKSTLTALGVEGLSLGIYLALVGADYIPWRFYATGDENKAGDYVGSDVRNAFFTFRLQPKFELAGITVGLDYQLEIANPTNRTGATPDLPVASDGNVYNRFKVHGGFEMGNFRSRLYTNLSFNAYETTRITVTPVNNRVPFQFRDIGLNLRMKDVVPGVLDTISLYYELAMAGQGTSITTDNAMGNSILLTTDFASNTAVHFGIGFVGGEAHRVVPVDRRVMGFSFGVQQAFPFMDTINMGKYHVFLQYNSGLSIFHMATQGKIRLAEGRYRIYGMGTDLRPIYDEVIIGVWFDY